MPRTRDIVRLLAAWSLLSPALARPALAIDVQRSELLPLDGTWAFRFAPDDRGTNEAWFTPAVRFDRTLQVPGCWDAQGVGEPTDKMRHNAVGVGWYRRSFRVPDGWRGRRVWLTVGGAHRSVRVWVNGKAGGEHVGYPTAYRVDITPSLSPAPEQTLTLAVDSRRDIRRDPLMGAFDILDYMDLTWGGIFEHVWLECTGPVWVDRAFARPDPAGPSVSFEINLEKAGAPKGRLAIALAVRPLEAGADAPPLARVVQPVVTDGQPVQLHLDLPGAPLWTPDSPRLLIADIAVTRDGQADDRCTIRFGLRRVTVVGSDFQLNGERFFLRGYGDDYTFPLEIAAPADVAFWRNYLQKRKDFGFNGVRHHSTMMSESYLTAADEVGMLIQPELPIAYDPFFKAATPEGRKLYLAVLRDYVRQMRNHPSVLAWCMGNEESNGFDLGPELVALARSLDPTRPVIDTDGVSPGTNRSTMDYLPVQFNEGVLPWGPTRSKYHVDSSPKPLLVHEMSNISVLPDPSDVRSYTGVIKPFWIEQMGDALRRQKLEPWLGAMLDASRRLQASLLKLNIESARLSPAIDGYDQWLFRDYWTQSTGFVDQFDRVRGMTPELARQFNGPAAILWDRDRVGYRAGERRVIRLFLSDFRPASAGALGPVVARLGGREVVLKPPAKAQGRGLLGPWVGEVDAPQSEQAAHVTLDARAGEVRNAWPLWVYPSPPAATGEVLVTRRLSRAVVDRLVAGARVLVTDEIHLFPTRPAAFKPAWWKGDDASDHVYGNLFARHPALKGFPTEGYGDLQTFRLLDGRPVVLLDELPVRVDPIVWSLDVPWRMRRKAYLFEVKVGAGRLLVSTMDLSEKACAQDAAVAWMRHCLVSYAASSAFQPASELPASWIRDRIGSEQLPDVATWVEGFAGKVECSLGQSRWLSDREDDVAVYPLRQTDGKQRLAWTTAPVPSPWPHPTVTFAWAGGIGWESQPGGGHFSLEVDGAPALDFAFTRTTTRTSRPDGRATLTYVVRRVTSEDSFGLFLLTLPADRVPPGHSVRLELRATAQNSQRWVSLVPYTDVVRSERGEP
jgi:hypothetical protein